MGAGENARGRRGRRGRSAQLKPLASAARMGATADLKHRSRLLTDGPERAAARSGPSRIVLLGRRMSVVASVMTVVCAAPR